MFYGEAEQALDGRGRLILPPTFRTDLAEVLVVTRGLDGCLLIFPTARWDRLAGAVAALPLTRGVARMLTRLLLGGASAQQLDAQGRVTLPEPLRRWAGLERTAVIVGTGDRLEVWSDVAWSRLTERLVEENADIAESLSQLGFALT